MIGRFINADGEISSTLDCGANLFSYCNNNPISLVDSAGNRPVVGLDPNKETKEERAASFASMRKSSGSGHSTARSSTSLSTSATATRLPKPESGNYYAVLNAGTLPDVCTPEMALSFMLVALCASILDNVISHVATLSDERQYNYWDADLISGQVVIGKGLSPLEAATRVAIGKNIMCANQNAAKHILFLNGYINAVGPEISRVEGAFPHYHPNRNAKPNVHIWYYP